MQDILKQYTTALSSINLFDLWEQELSLRSKIRRINIVPDHVVLENSQQLDFLFRSLYFGGRKSELFRILFNNMHIMPVLNWLVISPKEFIKEFLEFLPWYIDNIHVEHKKLQFLVRIYQEEYHEQFSSIVNVLDIDSCRYLVARSANPELRDLFKKRERQLLEKKKKFYYGIIDESDSLPSYSTIYGNKIDILIEGIDLLQKSSAAKFNDPYGAEQIHTLLHFNELLFQCGMIEDCLAILLDSYEDYQQKSRLVEIIEDKLIYKQFNKLLRKIIPIYSLLTNPLQAYSSSLQIYNRYFIRFNPDPASLQYLDIYESIAAGLTGSSKHILYEILYKSYKIQEYRPREILLIKKEEIINGLDISRVEKLQNAFEQKLFSLPHEAFVTMELIRLLQSRGLIRFNNSLAKSLLDSYLQLWKWIPGKIFINQPLLQQLGPFSDDSSRYEVEKIIETIDYYSYEKLMSDLITRPDLFKKRDENIRREIFTGKFMGVL